jgi:hypothetical protein
VKKFISTDKYVSMSTKLQIALCTMIVSMEAPRNGQAGFYKFQNPSGFLAHPVFHILNIMDVTYCKGIKLSLCLLMYHTMKTYQLFN